MTRSASASGQSCLSHESFVDATKALQSIWTTLDVRCDKPGGWLDVKTEERYSTPFLRISKIVSSLPANPAICEHDGRSPQGSQLDELVEEDDEIVPSSTLTAQANTPITTEVSYDILYSPTYSVPVLYIHIHSPYNKSGVVSHEQLYELLIPAAYQDQIRAVGIMGAVSLADHPATGAPAYFVHPCLTAEAMAAVSTSNDNVAPPLDWLIRWIGVVGSGVGLTVPLALARELC